MTDTEVEYVRQGRPPGARNKRTRELFDRLEARGDLDPADLLSSIVTNEEEPKELRVQAANMLLPYMHPKWQSVPVPRYLEDEIEVPEFTSVGVAENFLAEVTARFGSGTLSFDAAESFSKMTLGWIQSQYAKQGIDLKAQAQGATDRDTTIRIEGGLPSLPGTNVTMPPREINGNATYDLLEHRNPSSVDGVHTAEPSQALQTEFPPTNGGTPTCANAQVEPTPTGGKPPVEPPNETDGMM